MIQRRSLFWLDRNTETNKKKYCFDEDAYVDDKIYWEIIFMAMKEQNKHQCDQDEIDF